MKKQVSLTVNRMLVLTAGILITGVFHLSAQSLTGVPLMDPDQAGQGKAGSRLSKTTVTSTFVGDMANAYATQAPGTNQIAYDPASGFLVIVKRRGPSDYQIPAGSGRIAYHTSLDGGNNWMSAQNSNYSMPSLQGRHPNLAIRNDGETVSLVTQWAELIGGSFGGFGSVVSDIMSQSGNPPIYDQWFSTALVSGNDTLQWGIQGEIAVEQGSILWLGTGSLNNSSLFLLNSYSGGAWNVVHSVQDVANGGYIAASNHLRGDFYGQQGWFVATIQPDSLFALNTGLSLGHHAFYPYFIRIDDDNVISEFLVDVYAIAASMGYQVNTMTYNYDIVTDQHGDFHAFFEMHGDNSLAHGIYELMSTDNGIGENWVLSMVQPLTFTDWTYGVDGLTTRSEIDAARDDAGQALFVKWLDIDPIDPNGTSEIMVAGRGVNTPVWTTPVAVNDNDGQMQFFTQMAPRVSNIGEGLYQLHVMWTQLGTDIDNNVSGTAPATIYYNGPQIGLESYSGLLDIAYAKSAPLGTRVTIAGRVTVGNEFGGPVYIQDMTGAMPVFDVNFLESVSIGDSVMVTGPLSEFGALPGKPGTGQTQISGENVTWEVADTYLRYIPAMPMTLSSFGEGQEGMLVTIYNTGLNGSGTFNGNSNYVIRDLTGGSVLRIDGQTNLVGTPIPTGIFNVTGIITQFNGVYQLMPRFQSDIYPDASYRKVSFEVNTAFIQDTIQAGNGSVVKIAGNGLFGDWGNYQTMPPLTHVKGDFWYGMLPVPMGSYTGVFKVTTTTNSGIGWDRFDNPGFVVYNDTTVKIFATGLPLIYQDPITGQIIGRDESWSPLKIAKQGSDSTAVHFRVNLEDQRFFPRDIGEVYVRGNMIDESWSMTERGRLYPETRHDDLCCGNGIYPADQHFYSRTVLVDPAFRGEYEYKFVQKNNEWVSWEENIAIIGDQGVASNGNRRFMLNGDTTLAWKYWNNKRPTPPSQRSLLSSAEVPAGVASDVNPVPGANPSIFQQMGADLTVEAWVFMTNLPDAVIPEGPPVKNRSVFVTRPGSFNLQVYHDTTRYAFAFVLFNQEGQRMQVKSVTIPQTGIWYHVAGTYNGSELRLYINGNEEGMVSGSGSVAPGTNGFFAGTSSGSSPFFGLIDEVRLWDAHRNWSQLNQAMMVTLEPTTPGLIGYWPMEDLSSNEYSQWITPDVTLNHNHLVVKNYDKLNGAPFLYQVELPVSFIRFDKTDLIAGTPGVIRVTTDGWPEQGDVTFHNMPAGATFDGEFLTWTPPEGMSNFYTFTVSASNGIGGFYYTDIPVYIYKHPLVTEILTNDVLITSVRSDGTLGVGEGFRLMEANGLYEGQLIVGVSPNQVSGSVSAIKYEWGPVAPVRPIKSTYKNFENAVEARFNDSRVYTNPIGLDVKLVATMDDAEMGPDFAIYDYEIRNTNGYPLTDLFVGLGMDWDVDSAAANYSGFDPDIQMSYVYAPAPKNNPYYYGMVLLNWGTAGASTWLSTTPNQGEDSVLFNKFTDFSVHETNPADVRTMVSAGPFWLDPQQKVNVIYALLAAPTLQELRDAAWSAYNAYEISRPYYKSIALSPGWNLIGFGGTLFNDSTSVAFSSVMNRLKVALGYENEGLTWSPMVPPEMNTLQTVDGYSGYWMKMHDFANLDVTGYPFAPNTPIQLNAGWNLVSFLGPDEIPIAWTLEDLGTNLELVLGFDYGGLTYDPGIPMEFNTLQYMMQDHGYWIKVTEATDLIYRGYGVIGGGKESIIARLKKSPAKHVASDVPEGLVPTSEWMSVYGSAIKSGNLPLKQGSVITARDESGTLCGYAVVKEGGSFGLMAIYRDDPSTPEDEGAEPGSSIQLYVGDQLLVSGLEWKGMGSVVDVTNVVTSAGEGSGLPETFALRQNYPNPFNPSTIIRYDLPSESHVTIKIYSLTGEEVTTLLDRVVPAGYRMVTWNGQNSTGGRVASGMYFYRIQAGSFTRTMKMILLK